MGQSFDINNVIEHYKLDTNEVAEALFPHVRYKTLALNRVLKGEAFLDTEQLQALANLAGILVQDLFTFGDWKGSNEDGCLTLTRGKYKAKINYNGTYLTILKGSRVIAQEITCAKNMSVNDFISHINSIIKNN